MVAAAAEGGEDGEGEEEEGGGGAVRVVVEVLIRVGEAVAVRVAPQRGGKPRRLSPPARRPR